MPADPVAAGRKGGKSKSPAKIAAAKRNGFQPAKPAPETQPQPTTGAPALIFAGRKQE